MGSDERADGATLAELSTAARHWMDQDPDPATRAQMSAAIERGDVAELADLVGRRLEFGTAGLRGALGPGPNRMNRLLVRQATAGLARQLRSAGSTTRERGVVVGRDARHGSAEFAADIVEVLAAHGIVVHLFDAPVPTPLVAFALLHLGASAAVVVTASHNPAADNGMKVYWEDGGQIVAPVDSQIADAIDDVVADGEILPEPAIDAAAVHRLGGPESDDPVVVAYLEQALELVPGTPATQIDIALTSLHGVGATLVERVLRAGGHDRLHTVRTQQDPDPDFPTVVFPNPEEPGALDELFTLAASVGADVALANDPDADRLALAVVGVEQDENGSGRWRALTGDQTGALLAHRLLQLIPPHTERLIATTVVSSRLTARMAAAAGAQFTETLTGFKWLCRPGLEHPEWHQVLLYEEALGYAVGAHTRDKDGITAALVAADLIASLRAQQRTVWDVLDELAVQHGAHVQRNGSVRLSGPGWQDRLSTLVERIVAEPPALLGGQAVERTDRPASDVIRLFLVDQTRVVIRPSGTEPKLKYYCEAIEPVVTMVDSARTKADTRLALVVDEVVGLLSV